MTSPARRAALVAVGLSGAVAAVQLGGTDTGPELCVVRNLTGGWCPGCGGARAAHHLLHGDVRSAWVDHPWVVLATAQVAVVLATIGASVWVRRAHGSPVVSAASASGRVRIGAGALFVANGVLLLAIWLARAGAGAIPSPW